MHGSHPTSIPLKMQGLALNDCIHIINICKNGTQPQEAQRRASIPAAPRSDMPTNSEPLRLFLVVAAFAVCTKQSGQPFLRKLKQLSALFCAHVSLYAQIGGT